MTPPVAAMASTSPSSTTTPSTRPPRQNGLTHKQDAPPVAQALSTPAFSCTQQLDTRPKTSQTWTEYAQEVGNGLWEWATTTSVPKPRTAENVPPVLPELNFDETPLISDEAHPLATIHQEAFSDFVFDTVNIFYDGEGKHKRTSWKALETHLDKLKTVTEVPLEKFKEIKEHVRTTFFTVSKQAPTYFTAAMISELILLPVTLMQLQGQVSGSGAPFKEQFKQMIGNIKSNPTKVISGQVFSGVYRALQRCTHVTGMLVGFALMGTNKKEATYGQILGAAIATQVLTNWAICILDSVKINVLSSVAEGSTPSAQKAVEEIKQFESFYERLSKKASKLPTQVKTATTTALETLKNLSEAIKSGHLTIADLKLPFKGYTTMCGRNIVTFTLAFIGQQLGGIYSVMLPFVGAGISAPADFAKNYTSRHAGKTLSEVVTSAAKGAPRPVTNTVPTLGDVTKLTLKTTTTNFQHTATQVRNVMQGKPWIPQTGLKLGTGPRMLSIGTGMGVMFWLAKYLESGSPEKPSQTSPSRLQQGLNLYAEGMKRLFLGTPSTSQRPTRPAIAYSDPKDTQTTQGNTPAQPSQISFSSSLRRALFPVNGMGRRPNTAPPQGTAIQREHLETYFQGPDRPRND